MFSAVTTKLGQQRTCEIYYTFTSHPCQHLAWAVFNFRNSGGSSGPPCDCPLWPTDAEYLSTWFMPICIAYFMKCLLISPARFSVELFDFYNWLREVGTHPLVYVVKIFSQSMPLLFLFLMASFKEQKF